MTSKYNLNFMWSELIDKSLNSHFILQSFIIHFDFANEPLFRVFSNNDYVCHFFKISFNHRKKSRHQRYFQGWRVKVITCAATTKAIFIVNIILTVWASMKFDFSFFIDIMQHEKCDQTKQLVLWLHFVINVFSILLLSANNYCMQCLFASTRKKINKAHDEKRWLNIDIFSVKNLRRISWKKITLWWFFALSFISLHLMYNNVIFFTLSAQQYYFFTINSDFLTASSFESKKIDLENDVNAINKVALTESLNWFQKNISFLTKLNNTACIKAYGKNYIFSYDNLLLMSFAKNITSSLLAWKLYPFPFILSPGRHIYKWICFDYEEKFSFKLTRSCDSNEITAKADEQTIENQFINYCLSRKIEKRCKLQFSFIIMIIVILCNFVKMICMIVIAWKKK